jgi:acetyl esterase/lipase
VVIYIHGGALKFGTGIISAANTPHNLLLVNLERKLIQENIDVISVNYRLAPVHPWPIPLDDVKHAVNFVVAHASRWKINPHNIAVMGDSAGGELAMFVGLTMESRSMHRPLVRAVIDLFGPTDRKTFAEQWIRHYGLRPNPVYGVYTPKRVERESAIAHVHRGAPPFLIIQGTRDRVVPPEQSYLLLKRLAADGVPAREILVHHGGHELRAVDGPIHPTLRDLCDSINQFLVQQIKTGRREDSLSSASELRMDLARKYVAIGMRKKLQMNALPWSKHPVP